METPWEREASYCGTKRGFAEEWYQYESTRQGIDPNSYGYSVIQQKWT